MSQITITGESATYKDGSLNIAKPVVRIVTPDILEAKKPDKVTILLEKHTPEPIEVIPPASIVPTELRRTAKGQPLPIAGSKPNTRICAQCGEEFPKVRNNIRCEKCIGKKQTPSEGRKSKSDKADDKNDLP